MYMSRYFVRQSLIINAIIIVIVIVIVAVVVVVVVVIVIIINFLPHTNKIYNNKKDNREKKYRKWRGNLIGNHKAYNIRLPRHNTY